MPKANHTPLTEAQKRLAAENHALAYFAMRRYASKFPMRPDDLLSAAYDGLVNAARAFDPTKGFAFSTYAMRAIYQHMRRAKMEDGVIRIPIYQFEEQGKRRGKSSPHREHAERARKVASLTPILAKRQGAASRRHCHSLAVEEAYDPGPHERRERELAALENAIRSLPKRLRTVMRWRSRGVGIASISSYLKVSHEVVSEHERRAMELMRDHIQANLRAG